MPRPHIVLTGPSGSGKTTVGRALAAELGVSFVDVDARVEAALGAPVPEIFSRQGEPTFREAERGALRAALTSDEPSVIAPGGGALVDPASAELALSRGWVVGLVATLADRTARLANDSVGRPLLSSDLEGRLREQDLSRRDVYALVHSKVDANDAPAVVSARLAETWRSGVIPLRVGAHAYAARLAPARALGATREVLRARAPSRVFVVTDANVVAAHGDLVTGVEAFETIVLEPGETGKRLAAVERVLEALAAADADRDSVLVAIGGGVVSDLGGLAASLFARGIDWIALPTTLLAMVDAAVGGKTGANLARAKNLVGAFHHPIAVVVDPQLSMTEAPRAVASGLAEAVKSGLVGDAELFTALESAPPRPELAALTSVVRASLAVKARIVEADPRERGVRALLNFGHTFGHALEAATHFERWTHGEAVALGMVHALNIGAVLGVTPPEVAERARACLARLGLPIRLDRGEIEQSHAHLARDKKRVGSQLGFVVVAGLGSARVERLPLDALVRASWAAFDLHEFGHAR